MARSATSPSACSKFEAVFRKGCLLIAFVFTASIARAEDPEQKNACIQEHAESQKLKKAGKLSAAHELLLKCAREACPAPIRAECSDWAQEVEASTPSILVDVKAADGSTRSDVEIWIDGVLRAKTLSGMPIPLDPGQHEVEARPRGSAPMKRAVLVNLDDKRTRIDFTLPARPAAKRPSERARPAPTAKGIPTASIILGSLGVVALGTGGYFGYRAKMRADELEQCKPHCDRGEADSMRQKALIADVSLGVGVVAVGIATFIWLSQGTAPESAKLTF
jgi:hypothetical protein